MKKSEEERIKKIMKNLELTYEEALEVFESDKAIDRDEKLFELTKEQKKASKQARITTKTRVDAYGKKTTKEKKVNNEKIDLINILQNTLEESGAVDLQIVNAERIFTFTFNNTKYKIVMSVPRK